MWFPDCNVVKVLLNFKKFDTFNNLMEKLRSLGYSHGVNRLVDFLDRGDIPIVMIAETIHRSSDFI